MSEKPQPAIINFLLKRSTVLFLWFGLSFFVAIKQVFGHMSNNYLIYKFTFFNLIHQQNLYLPQPEHYLDLNHYGPLFGLFIAPFVWLPDHFGAALWIMFNTAVLFVAINQLPILKQQKNIILLLSAHELMTASFSTQFNPCMTAIILLSFVFIRQKRDFWAACVIILGTFIKLYGIVGLAFFFFSDQKLKFIASLIFWSVVFFLLPMTVSSPKYIVQTYQDWYHDLVNKNAENSESLMQDISVMGMAHRIFHLSKIYNLYILLLAVTTFGTCYLFIKKYKYHIYQLLILSSTLIFTVLFSSGSESPTYIIAFVGVAIWFINLKRPLTNLQIGLLIFAFILTSLSPSDLFPKNIKTEYIVKFALKALPCFFIWLHTIYEIYTRKLDNVISKVVS